MTNSPFDIDTETSARVVARGGSSTLLADGERHVIKRFGSRVPASVAHREAALARIVHAAGVKTPAVTEVLALAGAPAIRYERCHGRALLDCLLRDVSQVSVYAQRFAAAHVTLHQFKAADLPRLGDQLKVTHISRPIDVAGGVEMSDDDCTICHNDFQPTNVLIDPQQTWIVDWLNAARGPALADVAQTSLLLRFAPLPAELRDVSPKERIDLEALRRQFHDAYLQTYNRLSPFSSRKLAAWIQLRALAWPNRFSQPCLDPQQPWGDVDLD